MVSQAKTEPAITRLSDLLAVRAAQQPAVKVYRWLANGNEETKHLTFADLERRAKTIAATLQSRVSPGERVLLLYGPGLDFIEALFGCFYAGVIAVPAFAPSSRKDNPRIETLMRNASCSIALSTNDSLSRVRSFLDHASAGIPCVATDTIASDAADLFAWKPPATDIAYLQYTSGSTADPKGVIVTHQSVLSNLESIAAHGAFDESSISVNWLPHFHDMGLIYGILQPVYSCFRAVSLSPLAFIHRPSRWLSAISRYGGTHCGGPNFAYDLCLERVSDEEAAALDLSSWKVAFNGAEPIRLETLRRFAQRFSSCGFSAKAFYPVYGLAEASLKATSGEPGCGAHTCVVDRDKLTENMVEIAAPASASTQELLSCGRPSANHEIVVAVSDSCEPCAERTIGEIWLAGPSVAAGYWNNPSATERTFGAYLSTGKGPYLRTGDLGFIHDGDLFITGRLKDCIILRGRNYYPQDIEQTVEGCHPAVRRHGCAAVSIDTIDQEQVVVVAEIDRRKRTDLNEIILAIRQAVSEAHDIQLFAIALIPSGSMPKTSSGKIQRKQCRSEFLAGTLPVLAQWKLAVENLRDLELQVDRDSVLAMEDNERITFLEAYLQSLVSHMLKQPLESVRNSKSLARLGLDSVRAFELLARVEADLEVTLGSNGLLDESVSGIASRIISKLGHERSAQSALRRLPRPVLARLAPAQEQIWFLQQLYPESCAYNEHLLIRLDGDVDRTALERAVNEIVRRHEILRTTFISIDGIPHQSVQAYEKFELRRLRIGLQPEADQDLRSVVMGETQRPFHLDREIPVRFLLLEAGDREFFLLFGVHHIACDGSSLIVAVEELGALYEAFEQGSESPLNDISIQFADYSEWKRAQLEGGRDGKEFSYWQDQLAGIQPLDLPLDRLRPVSPTHRGDVVKIDLPLSLQQRITAFARQEGATIFTTLLSAFAVLLSKNSGQKDIVMGVPIADRTRKEVRKLIGYFVNTLPIRMRVDSDADFLGLLGMARRVTAEAHEHQHVTLDRLMDALPERDVSGPTLFNAMLAVQPDAVDNVECAGLTFSFPETHAGTAKVDLMLQVVVREQRLHACLEYSQDLFEAATVQRMAGHLGVVLHQMVETPGKRIRDLSVLTTAEQQQILVEWNRTDVCFPELCIHELFACQAAITPDAVAVSSENGKITYRELNHRSNQLARHLQNLGVGPEKRIALCLQRGADMVVAMLGTLKAGAAYVPLDAAYPKERLQFMLEDSQASVLLTQSSLRALLTEAIGRRTILLDNQWPEIALENDTDPGIIIDPNNLAYVIYTSGSTGRPKGVGIIHGGASVLVQWGRQAFKPEELRGVFASTSICFDLSVFEIFVPLSVGGCVILAQDALALPQWSGDQKVTLVNTVPTVMAELIRMAALPPSVRVVNLAGEALQRELVEQIYGFQQVECVANLYGPSEDTTYSTHARLRKGDRLAQVSIGQPIANTQAYVLDADLQPVPVGAAGELYLSGSGLARGYLNRPELTGEKFIANPFADRPGERMYRTGDRVKWNADGNLVFIGRLDHQIKLRGFRIELGEIEEALLQLGFVEKALVLVRERSDGERQLLAYVVRSRNESTKPNLRDLLRTRLPGYMVPAAIVEMEGFPLTPNGKVDRAKLPAPEFETVMSGADSALHSQEEEMLCGIFATLLGREDVGVEQDFFELGGHSLLATQVISRVRSALGVELPLRVIFEARTARNLAQVVRGANRIGTAKLPPLRRASRTKLFPLSYAQQRIWFLDQMDPGTGMYNMPFELRLHGELDEEALQWSLNAIVERHEALRTCFIEKDGSPWQEVIEAQQVPVAAVDLRSLPLSEREAAAHELSAKEASRPFDLTSGALLRIKVLRLQDDEYLLLFNMHHIVSDGWSVGVMVREFSSLYTHHVEGREAALPPLQIQYGDYSVWQRSWMQEQMLHTQLEYWRKQLDGVPALELPSRGHSVQMSRAAATRIESISPVLTDSLRAMGRREGVTLFISLLSAFAIALADFTGQKEVAIGTPVANRPQIELELLIGLFLNTLVIRNDLSGNPSFRELLRCTREKLLQAHAHQDVPFERLVEELAPKRDTARTPLFQAMVSMQTSVEEFKVPRLKVKNFSSRSLVAKFDILLLLTEKGGGFEAELSYPEAIYEESMIERLMAHWLSVVHTIADQVDSRIKEMPLLNQDERRQILQEFNPPVTDYRCACIHELFSEQVKRTPGTVAVKCGDSELSYAELNKRANRLARYLARHGVAPESRVGILMERGLDMVTGMLAIMKAGGAYVPLDPAYPPERLKMMAEDAELCVLLTTKNLQQLVAATGAVTICLDEKWPEIAAEDAGELKTNVDAENIAYLIYTSGSTGKPKAVAIPHRSAAALLAWGRETFTPAELKGTLASTSICFDLSVFEIFQPLVCGGKLILVPTALALEQFVKSDEVTLINTVPSAMRELLRIKAVPSSVKVINLAGEALQSSLVKEIFELTHVERVLNLYGPSEDTTYSTFAIMNTVENDVTIGKPVSNTQAYVIDESMRPVPVGVAGELWLAGEGLARGYMKRAEITAARFLPNPFSGRPGARMYRTGDQVRWSADGNLQFLGRLDHQVKLRGYRIELGEIECALMSHEEVEEAVVACKGVDGCNSTLIAYVVARQNSDLSTSDLRAHAKGTLPEYMVPGAYVFLEKLPLRANGKVNREALPESEMLSQEYVAPRTPVEITLAGLWSEVLKMERPGIRDNFFESGGHSLLAVQLVSRIREQFNVELPIRQLFERPTIESISEYLADLELANDAEPELVPLSREAFRI